MYIFFPLLFSKVSIYFFPFILSKFLSYSLTEENKGKIFPSIKLSNVDLVEAMVNNIKMNNVLSTVFLSTKMHRNVSVLCKIIHMLACTSTTGSKVPTQSL